MKERLVSLILNWVFSWFTVSSSWVVRNPPIRLDLVWLDWKNCCGYFRNRNIWSYQGCRQKVSCRQNALINGLLLLSLWFESRSARGGVYSIRMGLFIRWRNVKHLANVICLRNSYLLSALKALLRGILIKTGPCFKVLWNWITSKSLREKIRGDNWDFRAFFLPICLSIVIYQRWSLLYVSNSVGPWSICNLLELWSITRPKPLSLIEASVK